MIQVKSYKLVSDQIEYPELTVIIRELYRLFSSPNKGAVVELGCYNGTTSLFIQRALDNLRINNEFHVYDSFAGLPEKTAADQSPAGHQFRGGELSVSKRAFIKNFNQAGLTLPRIHTGWFSALTAADMPTPICFAFLDGDFYDSIRDSLRVITPQLADTAVIIVDDYQSEALPGARRAVDQWARMHGRTVRSEQSLAIIHWQS